MSSRKQPKAAENSRNFSSLKKLFYLLLYFALFSKEKYGLDYVAILDNFLLLYQLKWETTSINNLAKKMNFFFVVASTLHLMFLVMRKVLKVMNRDRRGPV
jgi:hypothetical protein